MHSTENSNKNSGSIVSNQPQQTNLNRECAGCGKSITERFLLKALDLFWHEDCLKCGCCDCRLGEVGSTLFTKANLILCRRDYLRLFGTTGYCAACNKVIPAFEMVMRAKNNVYHLECFACQQCNHRFCVGDRFYLCENKILCEYDYEERLVFANMTYNPSSLAHIRRQVSNLQPPRDNLIGSNNKQAIHSLPNKKNSKDDKRLAHSASFPGNGNSNNSSTTTTTNGNNNQPQQLQQLPVPPLPQPQPLQVNQQQQHPGAMGTTDDAASSGYGSPDSEIFEQ